MEGLKCLLCKKITSYDFKNIQKKLSGRIVTVKSIPTYYCKQCKRTYYTKEVVNVFIFLLSDKFTDTRMIVQYGTLLEQYNYHGKISEQSPNENDGCILSKVDICKENFEDDKQEDSGRNMILEYMRNIKDDNMNKLDNVYCGNYYEASKSARELITEEIDREEFKQVLVYHYSGVNPFKGSVIECSSNHIKLKIHKDFALMNFSEGDPTALKLLQSDKSYVVGSIVKDIDLKHTLATFLLDEISSFENQRRSERIPVSIYTEIRKDDFTETKKHCSIVKDISLHGMLIYSKYDFDPQTKIEVDLYTRERCIYLKGVVTRKEQFENYYAHGVSIASGQESDMEFLKKHIRDL